MEQQQENNTGTNTNFIWMVLGGLVIIGLLVWGWSYVSNNPDLLSGFTEDSSQVDTIDETGTDQEEEEVPTTPEEEQERLENIQSEREQLLAEQAQLEAQLSSTSTEDQQVAAERQQEIESELLELQNEEEYPPLPDPGL